MKNVVLIGMPGSGKSTVGVLLAKALGCDFVDTDVLLQVRCGGRLQELIDREGHDRFLKLEEEAVCSLAASGAVIATGGSVVYSAKAMEHLRQNGVVVYLQLPCGVIQRRIKNFATRGIALGPGQTLKDLYRERAPLYERWCDLCFQPPAGGAAAAVEALCAQLQGKR